MDLATEKAETRDRYRAHLSKRLLESHVPEQLHEGLVEYIASRRPVGHFLTAVLSNDLRGACGRADDVVRSEIWRIVFFLYNYAPGDCWGSPAHVEAYLTDPNEPPMVFE